MAKFIRTKDGGYMPADVETMKEIFGTDTFFPEKAKGVLPSNEWLIKNGYSELVKCMKKHPEKFAHIEQEEPKEKESHDN